MADNTELGRTEGIDSGTGQTPATPESTSPQAETRPTERKPDGGKVNWMEQPEFKTWQSKHDQRLAQERRQSQELAARLAQYEQQMEAIQTRDLDEPGKLAYENQKLKRYLSALQAQQAEQEGRQRVYGRISNTVKAAGFDIPPDVLQEAQDADDAWERAVKHLVATLPTKAAAISEKREANTVDIGGGAASANESQYDSAADKAFRNKDAQGYIKAILQGRGYT